MKKSNIFDKLLDRLGLVRKSQMEDTILEARMAGADSGYETALGEMTGVLRKEKQALLEPLLIQAGEKYGYLKVWDAVWDLPIRKNDRPAARMKDMQLQADPASYEDTEYRLKLAAKMWLGGVRSDDLLKALDSLKDPAPEQKAPTLEQAKMENAVSSQAAPQLTSQEQVPAPEPEPELEDGEELEL